MPRTGYKKETLALAIAITLSGSLSGPVYAVPLYVEGDGLSNSANSNVTGGSGDTAAIELRRSTSSDGSDCSRTTTACTYTNAGFISANGASSAVNVAIGAQYNLVNSGSISASTSGGTAITTAADSGDLTITNTGSIEGQVAIDFNVNGKSLSVTSSGTITGDILVEGDSQTDSLTLTGGSFKGTTSNLEKINIKNGRSTANGTFGMNSGRVLVFSKSVLHTSGLTLTNGDLFTSAAGILELEIGSSNTGGSATAVISAHDQSTSIGSGTIHVIPQRDLDLSSTANVFLMDTLSVGLSGLTLSRVTSSELFDLSGLTTTGGDLKVNIVRNSTDPRDIIKNNGGSSNSASAYDNAYNAARNGSDANSSKLYRAIASKVGASNTVAFAEELAPTTNGSAINLAQTSLDISHQNIASRLNAVSGSGSGSSGINSGSILATPTVWVQGLHGEGEQDDRRRSDGTTLRGYTSRINGFTLGLDTEIGTDKTAGVALSIGQGSVNKNEVKDNTSLKTYLATLYGRWHMDSITNLDIFLSYGHHRNSRKRFFDVENAVLNQAEGSYDSRQYGIKAELGRTYMMDGWAVTPSVGLHYGRFDIDGYKEKGSAAALEMEKQRYEMTEVGLGVGISRTFHFRKKQIMPEIKIMGWHDFSSDPVEVDTRFVVGGDTFVAKGLEPEKTTWTASAGLTAIENDRFQISTGYELSWKEGYRSDNVYLRAEYQL